jgi:hypothetical protein
VGGEYQSTEQGEHLNAARTSPVVPTLGPIPLMAVSKVSLSLDEAVLAEARARVGRREL